MSTNTNTVTLYSNEPLANRAVTDLDELEDRLAARCVTLMVSPELIKGHTCVHWWLPDLVKHDVPVAS